MKKIILGMALIVAVLFGGAYEEGIKAFENKEFDKAIAFFEKAAKEGNIDAQAALVDLAGMFYQGKNGLEQNQKKGLSLMEAAAQYGYLPAAEKLSAFYEFGFGGEKNEEKAKKYYMESIKILETMADAGDSNAMHQLANKYFFGLGYTKMNKAKAVSYLKKCANLENPVCEYDLGVDYLNGEGVKQDYNEAIRYFKKSANQGHRAAQNNLGLIYMNGMGVAKDDKKAYKYLKKSADQGYKTAQSNLQILCKDNPTVCQQ